MLPEAGTYIKLTTRRAFNRCSSMVWNANGTFASIWRWGEELTSGSSISSLQNELMEANVDDAFSTASENGIR